MVEITCLHLPGVESVFDCNWMDKNYYCTKADGCCDIDFAKIGNVCIFGGDDGVAMCDYYFRSRCMAPAEKLNICEADFKNLEGAAVFWCGNRKRIRGGVLS